MSCTLLLRLHRSQCGISLSWREAGNDVRGSEDTCSDIVCCCVPPARDSPPLSAALHLRQLLFLNFYIFVYMHERVSACASHWVEETLWPNSMRRVNHDELQHLHNGADALKSWLSIVHKPQQYCATLCAAVPLLDGQITQHKLWYVVCSICSSKNPEHSVWWL